MIYSTLFDESLQEKESNSLSFRRHAHIENTSGNNQLSTNNQLSHEKESAMSAKVSKVVPVTSNTGGEKIAIESEKIINGVGLEVANLILKDTSTLFYAIEGVNVYSESDKSYPIEVTARAKIGRDVVFSREYWRKATFCIDANSRQYARITIQPDEQSFPRIRVTFSNTENVFTATILENAESEEKPIFHKARGTKRDKSGFSDDFATMLSDSVRRALNVAINGVNENSNSAPTRSIKSLKDEILKIYEEFEDSELTQEAREKIKELRAEVKAMEAKNALKAEKTAKVESPNA